MPEPLPTVRRSRRGAAAALLLTLGVLLLLASRLMSGAEHHAYAAGGAPEGVHVTAGRSYLLSLPGGVKALQARGADPSPAGCTLSTGDAAVRPLPVTGLGAGTNATDAVASFVAPLTGQIEVSCSGWGRLYVDDADGAGFDSSGLALVLGTAALTVGAGLALSALRTSLAERRALTPDPSGAAPAPPL